ncbi:hypothetical protein B296_00005882 [Ensete ventricosum]|uniref:H(+)/Pi cotransporter n=1 Tax=Ensete ventricosum TaxID=4639 RepID=A0A427AUU3_ENSVE|nr:hypothetical protein B296_00005882 [Ensete ventricosum]
MYCKNRVFESFPSFPLAIHVAALSTSDQNQHPRRRLAHPWHPPSPGLLRVKGVAFVGTLSGQLFFGWLGDKLGRKCAYGMTLMLMVLCSVASGLSFGHSPKGVMATLCFFRFWLGFGIGGDYPLSATIMS